MGIVLILAFYFIGTGGVKQGLLEKAKLELDRRKMVSKKVAEKWKSAYTNILVMRAALKIKHFKETQTNSSVRLTWAEIAERRKRVEGVMNIQRRLHARQMQTEAHELLQLAPPEQKSFLKKLIEKFSFTKHDRTFGSQQDGHAEEAQAQDKTRIAAAAAMGGVAATGVVAVGAATAAGHGPVDFEQVGDLFDDNDDDSHGFTNSMGHSHGFTNSMGHDSVMEHLG